LPKHLRLGASLIDLPSAHLHVMNEVSLVETILGPNQIHRGRGIQKV
jgi:hypothetical protein